MDQNKIKDIENYQGWKVQQPKCLICGYNWVAVSPDKTDSTNLECPKCSNQKTIILIK